MRLIFEETTPGAYDLVDADVPDRERAGLGVMVIHPARTIEIFHALLMAAAEQGVNSPIIEAAETIEQRYSGSGVYEDASDLILRLVKAVRDRRDLGAPDLDETPNQAQRRRAKRVNPEFMKKLEPAPRFPISIAANVVRFLVSAWVKDGGPEGKECGYLDILEVIILDLVKRHDELSRQYSDMFQARYESLSGALRWIYEIPGGSNQVPGPPPDPEEFQACSECGRKTWARSEFSQVCAMTQPDGRRCTGVFR